ncbi:MAG: DUF4365 domain-containing protein [Rhodospirillales bacterium]
MAMNAENGTPPYLGMARTAQQESFGDAFLLAVASVAGCAASRPRPDDDSVDWTLSCRLRCRPKLDVQMKTISTDDAPGDVIRYALKKKNYSDLILTNVLAPRILVLVTVPEKIENWLSLTTEGLVLRRCGYWVSLAGEPESDNETSVTVSVPRRNLLTPKAVRQMMHTINKGGAL